MSEEKAGVCVCVGGGVKAISKSSILRYLLSFSWSPCTPLSTPVFIDAIVAPSEHFFLDRLEVFILPHWFQQYC